MALLVMKVLTLRNLTLAVFPEVILATKLFPEYCSSLSELAAIIFTCFVVNYGIWAIVWMYLWPCIFSPLRHVPGPKVC